jgi:hypothetical protein
MAQPNEARLRAVRRLIEAARELVLYRASLMPQLVASTGLSPEGVELAMTKHLELSPSEAELERLFADARDVPAIAVVLSANVFVGALRALVLARASSDVVLVRPSRREPVFAKALVEAAADPALRLEPSLTLSTVSRGEVHVYGSHRTLELVRDQCRSSVLVVGHGSGMGAAWISTRASLDDAARSLAEDVVAFDQRGCLSPRVALVEGDATRALDFATVLHERLTHSGKRVPRGPLPRDVLAESERYRATMAYAGRTLVGPDHVVGLADMGTPLLEGPAYRHMHVVPVAHEGAAEEWLLPVRSALISVGSDDLNAAKRIAPPWARCALLGRMQRPPLDGPVDRRVWIEPGRAPAGE